jgi:trimethylamine:corrinoid methyltransferase-like protein
VQVSKLPPHREVALTFLSLCGFAEKSSQGPDLSPEGIAMEASREVGPGGNYLRCAHTQRNFKTAFYTSTIADNNSYKQWGGRRRQGCQRARHRSRAEPAPAI